MGRDSILFFRSFYEAALLLGEKARLKLYDSILQVSFSDYETIEELKQNCAEVESKLKYSRTLFAQFSLIKPHLISSGRYCLNGKKGGGQLKNTNAKKRAKNEQEEERNEEVEKKEIEIERKIEEELNSPEISYFLNTFKEKCKMAAAISFNERVKLKDILNDLISQGYTLEELTEALCFNFNKIDFNLPSFTPSINWLLKSDAENFYATLNGQNNKRKTDILAQIKRLREHEEENGEDEYEY